MAKASEVVQQSKRFMVITPEGGGKMSCASQRHSGTVTRLSMKDDQWNRSNCRPAA